MRLLITIFAYSLMYFPAWCQIKPDDVNAIRTLLLYDQVAKNIFLHYDEKDWSGKNTLPPGDYAFICPDTTFRKIYPSILDEFPFSIGTDGLIYQRTFYKDSLRGIYINGSFGPEQDIVFTKLDIEKEFAAIEFFTTAWFNLAKFQNKYLSVTATLKKRHGCWVVDRCDVDTISWRQYFKINYIKN